MVGVAAALLFFTGSCGKREAGPGSAATAPGATPESAASIPVAAHLGFATRLPADADLYLAGFHANQALEYLAAVFIRPEEQEPGSMDEFNEALAYVGDEAFLMIGNGMGRQLETLGSSYRDLSASMTGLMVGSILDRLAKTGAPPDFAAMEEIVPEDFAERWLEVLQEDARLLAPSVVIGWRPETAKVDECREAVAKWLKTIVTDTPDALSTQFDAQGSAFAGFEISGKSAFRGMLQGARDAIAGKSDGGDPLKQVSPERIEQLLAALENLRLTLACGIVDGRVVIYLGNGPEGLRLASTPGESLAATPGLGWTAGFSTHRHHGALYLSEAMVRSVLPLMDGAPQWEAVGAVIREPIREQRVFRELIAGLAKGGRALSARDASALGVICFADNGLRLESRGGWPDPGLDYSSPLRMSGAAVTLNPAIRAHWVRSRERTELEWDQLEHYGALVEAIAQEILPADPPAGGEAPPSLIPSEPVRKAFAEIREINRAWRDELHAGLGDEIAVMADFRGEVPPIPGISGETVRDAKAPRLMMARPVTDRTKVDAAGASFFQSWQRLTTWASEVSGENLPLISPASVESGGLLTWYPPLPFIGGDFVPGVSLNDRLWMAGTSRAMAADFSKAMDTPPSGTENGVIIEVDFKALREWIADIYQRNREEAEALVGESMNELSKTGAPPPDLDALSKRTQGIGMLRYRHWLEGGVPRSSLRVESSPSTP